MLRTLLKNKPHEALGGILGFDSDITEILVDGGLLFPGCD